MDHVETEQERDLRRALFDGDLLERVELLAVVEPEDGAGAALADDVFGLGRIGEQAAGKLGELPDLLLEAHPREQGVDARRDFGLGWDRRRCLRRCPRD